MRHRPAGTGKPAANSSPNVMALPGTGTTFEQFRYDDMMCRDFALQQIGGSAREQAASGAAISHAAVGTVIGAVAGAAIGGQRGAGVGAGTGLIIGSASGAEASRSSVFGSQRQYDIAYVQCMYAKGHRVPVSASYSSGRSSAPATVQAAPVPPPPAGMPPPPPPSISR